MTRKELQDIAKDTEPMSSSPRMPTNPDGSIDYKRAYHKLARESLPKRKKKIEKLRAERDRMATLALEVIDEAGGFYPERLEPAVREAEKFDRTKSPDFTPKRSGDTWPVRDMLRKLADAADHLLLDHDCDAHGYEQVSTCVIKAREYLEE